MSATAFVSGRGGERLLAQADDDLKPGLALLAVSIENLPQKMPANPVTGQVKIFAFRCRQFIHRQTSTTGIFNLARHAS